MKKERRAIYRVKPVRRGLGGWRMEIKHPNGAAHPSSYAFKRTAVAAGRRWARRSWERHGMLAQLVVHGRDGKIQFEHTYGRDPRGTKG